MKSWSLTDWLRRRLLLLVAGLWIAATFIAVYVGTAETNDVFDNALESAADAVALLAPADPGAIKSDAAARLEQVALDGNRADYVTYQIRSATGTVLHRSSRAPATPYPIPNTPGFKNDGSVRYFTRPVSDQIFVQVAEQPKERRKELLRLLLSFIFPLLALLLAAFVVATRLAKAVGDSLLAITSQVRLRNAESLAPLQRDGLPTELRPVVDGLNLLLDRLKRALEAERSFSANCAHELRNPIAAAKAQADLVAEKLAGGEEHTRLQQLSQVLTRLGRYIERLLQLNRAEAGFGHSGRTCDLLEVTNHLIDEYARRPASANRLDFDDGGVSQMRVAIDQDALAIALGNLLDNAIAYSDPGSEIQVHLSQDASIEVTNDAAALSPQQLERLPRRHERGANDTKVGGFGLGLSIVDQIVRQSGGSLELRSPARGLARGFQALIHLRRA